MKSGKEVKLAGRTFTSITCDVCGRETRVSCSIKSKYAKQALERNYRTCHPVVRQGGTSWWYDFGLKQNPYVYGPMPCLRTSKRWRIEEARKMGWLAWYLLDEYTDERFKVIFS